MKPAYLIAITIAALLIIGGGILVQMRSAPADEAVEVQIDEAEENHEANESAVTTTSDAKKESGTMTENIGEVIIDSVGSTVSGEAVLEILNLPSEAEPIFRARVTNNVTYEIGFSRGPSCGIVFERLTNGKWERADIEAPSLAPCRMEKLGEGEKTEIEKTVRAEDPAISSKIYRALFQHDIGGEARVSYSERFTIE